MTDMPGRPPQHATATGAERAFESALPAEWTAEARRHDYGIDYDVEIFLDGQATGLRFGVQVKGAAELTGNPSARIRQATLNYWSRQDQPILIVLWEQASNTLWWMWHHKIDMTGVRPAESYTIPFPTDQTWDDRTAEQILQEVAAWRAWQTPMGELPLSVTLRGEGTVAGIDVGRVVGRIRRRLEYFPALFEVRRTPRTVLYLSLDVHPEKAVLWISGGPSSTLHYENLPNPPNQEAAEQLLDWLSADLLLLIAHRLAGLNLMTQAGQVAAAVMGDSSVIERPDFAFESISLFLANNQSNAVLELLNRFLREPDSPSSAAAIQAVINNHVLDEQIREVVDLMLEWSDRYKISGDRAKAARLTYNASRVLGQIDPVAAGDLLDGAAALDPTYTDRGYWWRERGGSLFLAGQYTDAQRHYQRAVELGDRGALPLLADALLMTGQYRAALEVLSEVVEDGDIRTPEWALKNLVVGELTQQTGIEEQVRQEEEAADKANDATDPQTLREALDLDLLCSEALHRLGRHAAEAGEPSAAYHVAAALFTPTNPLAWLFAIDAVGREMPEILDDVVACAKRFAGRQIHDLIEGLPAENRENIEVLLDEAPDFAPRPFELRLIGEDGDYQVLVFE